MNITAAVEIDNQSEPETPSSPIQLVIERASLLNALSHVQSVVEKRNTIPILANVKLETKDSALSLTATDMDITITETVAANVQKQGALTVPAHTLYDIVRKLPDGSQIELSGDSDSTGRLHIVSGSCDFTLACLGVTDFPVMDLGNTSHQFTIGSAELTSLIDRTRFAMSNEETRYYLNGLYFHVREDEESPVLRTVSTDGHRLALAQVDMPEGASGMTGVIIPKKTVGELRKLFDEVDGEIEVSLSENKVCFVSGSIVFMSKLIDGTFPDYDKVIPEGNDAQMLVQGKGLAQAVDRVSTISTEKTSAVRFSFGENILEISAISEEHGSASEGLQVKYAGSDLEINFSARYVLEMLGSLQGDNVEFMLSENGGPAVVRDEGDSTALYVIMPMHV